MADVEVKCEQCGAPIILSEYAAMNTIICRACGSPLRAHSTSPTDTVHKRLKLKTTPPPVSRPNATPAAPPPSKPDEQETWRFERYIQNSRAETQTKVRTRQTGVIWTWLVFIVLAALMAALRFMPTSPPAVVDFLVLYGPYVVLVIHVGLILMAFKDTVFQGILCLLIPGYSFFYILFVADNFWVRALVGGLLAGIGFDSALRCQEVAARVYHTIRDYIASGG